MIRQIYSSTGKHFSRSKGRKPRKYNRQTSLDTPDNTKFRLNLHLFYNYKLNFRVDFKNRVTLPSKSCSSNSSPGTRGMNTSSVSSSASANLCLCGDRDFAFENVTSISETNSSDSLSVPSIIKFCLRVARLVPLNCRLFIGCL